MESDLLFPRKFDRSHWALWIDIDRSLDSIKVTIHGTGGQHAEVILSQRCGDRSCANWGAVFEHAAMDLRDQLEIQLDDSL